MVLGEASKKEQQGPRSHKVVDPSLNEKKDDDIQIQIHGKIVPNVNDIINCYHHHQQPRQPEISTAVY